VQSPDVEENTRAEHALEPAADNAPNGQFVHEDEPLAKEKVPAEQSVQADEATALEYWPAAHTEQYPEPELMIPTPHRREI